MITVDIVDGTQVESGKLYVTGHGIPGSGPANQLSVLGTKGRFVQGAVEIETASCDNGIVTIITAVPHQLQEHQEVFVSGVSVPGYNGVFAVMSADGAQKTFTYNVHSSLSPGSGGVAYLPALLSRQSIKAANAESGTVTVTLDGAANIPVKSPIYVVGLTGSGAGWNGVWTVSGNPWTTPALSANQFQIAISGANGPASVTWHATVYVASLTPVAVQTLPANPQTRNPSVVLDQSIATYSAQLVPMLTPAHDTPFPIGVTPGTVNPINLATPPFSVGEQVGNSLADIVEFYYAGSGGYSTFDVSQVDGFALPLTLQASHVSKGPKRVGLNTALPHLNRYAIGKAFSDFLSSEPADLLSSGKFDRLLYSGPVDVEPLTVAPALQPGTPLSNVQFQPNGANVKATASAPHGLAPGQTITVSGAGAPYDGSWTVLDTGLNDTSLTATQFSFNIQQGATALATGTVTPTDAGVIAAAGAATLVVEITSGTPPSPTTTVRLSGVLDSSFDADYIVLRIPQDAGLPASAVYLATKSGQAFPRNCTSGGGILGVPVFLAPPSLPGKQFYLIAAPKDWLAKQHATTANADPMATWWDTTINLFFSAGNYLQIAIGVTTSYTGVYNASKQAFDFYNGLSRSGTPSFSIYKPSPARHQSQSLANAMWVWAQAAIPANDVGTVWDQIVQAFCRGVALDGVLKAVPTMAGQSNAAWTNTTTWYAQHPSRAFPSFTSRYCPFSKFLHYSTLQGTIDRTGSNSIYLYNLAYGFSEDETPLGQNGSAISTGTPSKLDSTVPDNTTMTLIVGSFLPPVVAAEANAIMESGVVLEVVVRSPGSGYVAPPIVEITPPTKEYGSRATAVATVSGGQVTNVHVTYAGSGYDFEPQITFIV